MFILRLLFVAICVVMLLPMEASGDRQAKAENFCQRYPKTCGASDELWTAFKLKLAYAVKLARKELSAQYSTRQQPYAARGQMNEWRPQDAVPGISGYTNGTLSQSERVPDWPRNTQ